MKSWSLVLAAVLILGVASPAFALQRICATTYSAPVSELKDGWRVLGIYLTDGAIRRKMSKSEWRECHCPRDGSDCVCCEFDLAKMCAELDRIHQTTSNRLHLEACEGARS